MFRQAGYPTHPPNPSLVVIISLPICSWASSRSSWRENPMQQLWTNLFCTHHTEIGTIALVIMLMHTFGSEAFLIFSCQAKKQNKRDNSRQVFSLKLSWGWIAWNIVSFLFFCLISPHSFVSSCRLVCMYVHSSCVWFGFFVTRYSC